MTVTRGIDISRWQGDFDWHAQAGLSFGMAKATEGTGFTDPEFGRNWDAMWWYQADHRMPRFAYCFFHAAQDPEGQAEHLVSTVKAHGLLPGDNFCGDFEATDPDTGLNDEVAPDVFAQRAVRFLQTVNRLAPGHRILPYEDPSFAQAGHSAGMAPWYLWIADYGVQRAAVPAPWSQWTFWQNGDSPVDTDVFNGDEAALLAFCRMPDKR